MLHFRGFSYLLWYILSPKKKAIIIQSTARREANYCQEPKSFSNPKLKLEEGGGWVITCHKLRLSDAPGSWVSSIPVLGSVSLKRLIAKNIILPLNAIRSRSQSISSYFLPVQYLFLCQLQLPIDKRCSDGGGGVGEGGAAGAGTAAGNAVGGDNGNLWSSHKTHNQ